MSFTPPTGDATATKKGLVRLDGDLGGTATTPTVPGLANKADISHTHIASDITDLSSELLQYAVIVKHGAVASTTRPLVSNTVIWIGTVQPTNIANGDIYMEVGAAPSSPWSGPLDGLTTPHRAVSLRRLLTSYTGALIRVRRSSDQTEQDIGYNSSDGSLDTTALTTFVGSSSAYIVTWYDQSSHGYNLTQATTASQPLIVSSGTVNTLQTHPAALFDGVDDYLTSSTVGLYAAGSASMALVFSGASASNSTVVSEHSTNSSNMYRLLRSSTAAWNVQATNSTGTSLWATSGAGDTTFDSAQHRLFYADNGTSISTWRDNASVHSALTATRSGTLTPTAFTLGAHAASTPTNFLSGNVQELVVWTADMTVSRSTIYTAQSGWL